MRPRYAGLAALAAATGLVMLAVWGWRGGGSEAGFGWVALAYGALYGAGAYAAMWWRRGAGGGEAARAAPAVWEARLWGWLAVAAVIGYLAVGWWFMEPLDALLPWWLIALLLAAVMAIAAWPVAWREGRLAKGDEALGALAVGVAALLSFAAHLFVTDMDLGRQWIGVTWALVMAAAVWAAGRLGLAHLRWAAGALAVLVAARLLANPHVLDYEFGGWIVFNWLLYGYGVPIACFALAAWVSRRDGAAALGGWLEAGAVAMGFAMVTLMVRHGFHAEQIRAAELTLYESATYSVAWAVLALLLTAGAESRRAGSRGILAWWGAAITCLALLMAVVGSGLIVNPARTGEAVGGLVVLNGLLYVYGGPAALLAAAAWQLRRCAERLKIEELEATSGAAGFGSLLLAFGLVTMLVRHGFHPADMSVRAFTLYESATYSTAWAVLAAVLALAGLRAAHGGLARLGGVMAITALLMAVVGSGWVVNPVRTGDPVGAVAVLNGLLYVYGVPALLLAAAAWWLRQGGSRLRLEDVQSACWVAGLGALALAFGMVTLQVRQAFHGASLAGPAPDNAEWYAYSAAWIVFAAVLLAAGVITGGRTLRLASLAVMCGAVAKVFLFDARHLEDLWAVLSYLGLGVSLMLLAWVYQRFVFARELGKASPQMDADAHG